MQQSFTFLNDAAKRVIYNALPQVASKFHSETDVTDSAYLVEYWEQHYLIFGNRLNKFLNFDGEDFTIFEDDQLDSMAPFFGFSDEWYDTLWDKKIKIKLFKGVYRDPFIWRFRGSMAVFDYMVSSFGITAYLTKEQGFIAGISKAGDVCGSGSGPAEFILKYPNSYTEDSKELGFIDYLQDNKFIPAHVHIKRVQIEL